MQNRLLIRTTAPIVLIFLLMGCATNPITGRLQFMIISEDFAINASKEAYVKMLDPLEQEGIIDNDPEVVERINHITAKLIAQALKFRPETENWEWRVKIIDDPDTVNAFCMAGGRMAIYTGLIEQLDATDDELAQVMGHEIAHALSAHSAEKMSVIMTTDLVVAGYAATQDPSREAVTAAALVAALVVKLPNSRQAEFEADVIGIEIAARAGYDPHAAVTLWDKMSKVSGGSTKFDFLSTHPAPEKRMKKLGELIPEMLPYYEEKGDRPVYPLDFFAENAI